MSTRTKLVLSALIAAAVVIAVVVAAYVARSAGRDDAFVIDRFDRHVVVGPAGDLEVTETIDVTFTQPRRGLFRDLEADSPAGGRVHYFVEDVDQGSEDQPWRWVRQSTETAEPRIRIGDANVVLDPGPQTYRLRYRIEGLLFRPGARPDQVQVRLDVPGDRWPTEVQRTSLTVELPGEPTRVRCVVGAAGTTEPCPQASEDGSTVTQTVGALDQRETATLAIEFPAASLPDQGGSLPEVAVTELDQREPLAPLGVPLLPALLILLLLLAAPAAVLEGVRSRRVYRDVVTDPHLHHRATPTAELEAPDGLAPVEVARLAQRSVDQEALLATILDLEIRGVVATQSSSDGEEIVVGPGRTPSGARPWEAAALEALCPGGAPITFDGEYDPTATKRTTLAKDALQTHVKRVLSPDSRYVHREGGALHGGGYVLLVALVLAVGAAVGTVGGRLLGVPRPAVVAAWIGLGVAWLALAFLWRKERLPLTSEGRDVVARTEAFRTFLAEVHADRLEFAAGQQEVGTTHPAVAMLPYAMVLGLADSWLGRFEPLLEAAARDGRAGAASDPGAWYLHRASYLAATSSISSSTTAPSSSGGSGGAGGGAGSGGGGGGGGSW